MLWRFGPGVAPSVSSCDSARRRRRRGRGGVSQRRLRSAGVEAEVGGELPEDGAELFLQAGGAPEAKKLARGPSTLASFFMCVMKRGAFHGEDEAGAALARTRRW